MQTNRVEVEKVLRAAFPAASATIRYGGSKAKGTLIREFMTSTSRSTSPTATTRPARRSRPSSRTSHNALARYYFLEPRTSALRLRSRDRRSDLHIDVVPGRFTDDSKTDCFLHQENGEKDRLKTKFDVHIAHIRDSGVVDTLRLLKLWRVHHRLQVKQFAFELSV